MTITTYSDLKNAVSDWLSRADLAGRVPTFIALAEAKLNRTMHHPLMEIRVATTVVTTSDEPQFICLPDNFQSMRRVSLPDVTGAPSLEFKSEAQLARYRTSISNTPGQPRYFTVFGDEMELVPTPDSAYELEMVYRATLPALTADNTTNWLLDAAPDLYLYGALLQAAPYLDEEKKEIGLWAAAYATAHEEMTLHGQKYKYGPTPMRITLAGEVTP